MAISPITPKNGTYTSSATGQAYTINASSGILHSTAIQSSGNSSFIIIDGSASINTEDYSKKRQDTKPIVLSSVDDAGKAITMTLDPESSISAIDVLKITLLINDFYQSGNSFWSFKYIKNNNLERHFRFEQ